MDSVEIFDLVTESKYHQILKVAEGTKQLVFFFSFLSFFSCLFFLDFVSNHLSSHL